MIVPWCHFVLHFDLSQLQCGCILLQKFPSFWLQEEEYKMAAAVKALNAKIRSNKYLDYFLSTRE